MSFLTYLIRRKFSSSELIERDDCQLSSFSWIPFLLTKLRGFGHVGEEPAVILQIDNVHGWLGQESLTTLININFFKVIMLDKVITVNVCWHFLISFTAKSCAIIFRQRGFSEWRRMNVLWLNECMYVIKSKINNIKKKIIFRRYLFQLLNSLKGVKGRFQVVSPCNFLVISWK